MIEVKDIGELTQRVQILAPTQSVGANGERLETWGEYATRWMKIEPVSGAEAVADDMAVSVSKAKFTARYDSTINEKYRFVWNAQTWNIRGIEFSADKMFIAFVCDTNTITGGSEIDYGDYYATNSLKIRYITATTITTDTPSQAEIDADVGLTATQAGQGYVAAIYVAGVDGFLLVISTGSTWLYTHVYDDLDLSLNSLTTAALTYSDTYWEDLNINTGIFEFAGNADPTLVTWDMSPGLIMKAYEFAKNDEAFFKIQCPHKMKTGTHLWAHLHWTPGARGIEESGNLVGWKVDFQIANIGSQFPKYYYTIDLSDACDGFAHRHQMTPNVEQDVGAIGISSFIIGRIYRSDTGTDDTWAGTVSGQLPLLLGFDFHYEVDSPGSQTISAK